MAWIPSNNGEHTFERGSSRSHIDVTLSSEAVARRILGWKIRHKNPYTHHGQINFKIDVKIKKPKKEYKKIYLNTHEFTRRLMEMEGESGDGVYADLLEAFKKSTAEEDQNISKKPYWWNDEIEESRKEYNKIRRQIGKMRRRGDDISRWRQREKEEAKTLERLIRKSKKEKWKEMLAGLDGDIWGQGYRIATGQIMRGRLAHKIPGQMDSLYPHLHHGQTDQVIWKSIQKEQGHINPHRSILKHVT